MLIAANAAIALDAFTTYAALTATVHGFSEQSARTAGLIYAHGLVSGILLSALARLLVFGLLALTAMIWPRLAPYLLAIGFVGAAFTWAVALLNVWTVTHP
jgi:hypothetical protein